MQVLRSRPYTLLFLLLCIALAAPFVLRKVSEWDDVYIRAANHLCAGQTIYDPHDGYAYPPFMAFLSIPFTYLPPLGSRAVFYLVNVLCLAVMVRSAWRVAGGGELEGAAATDKREHVIFLLGLACAFRYSFDALAHQQTDLIVGALVLGGCFLLQRARAWSAATCFGLAAAMKCTPLLWALYLVWRRQGRAAAWLLAVACGANLLPDLVNPSPHGGPWVGHWLAHYLLPMGGGEYLPGTWHSAILYNQSLSGLGQRFLVLDWSTMLESVVRANPPGQGTVKALIYGGEFALLLFCGWALGWRSHGESVPLRPAVEYSVVIAMMLLLSPMSSKPHFCTLLLPAFCLARLGVMTRDRLQLGLVVAAIVVGTLSIRGLVGVEFSTFMLWCGAVTWSTLLLLAGCVVALCRLRLSAEPQATLEAQPPRTMAA